MPRNVIGEIPFPPVVIIDKDEAVVAHELSAVLDARPDGVSVCVRYSAGKATRGGYFFHIRLHAETGLYSIFDIEHRQVAELPFELLLSFVNHCTGRRFDAAALALCQTQINLLKDG